MTTETTRQHTPKVTHECPRCGKDVALGQGGRPKKWCSDTCRKRASQERVAVQKAGVDVRVVTIEHEAPAAPVAPSAPPREVAPPPAQDWAATLGGLCRGDRSTADWVAMLDAVTEGIERDRIDSGPPFTAVLEAFHRLSDAVNYRLCLPANTLGLRKYGDPRPLKDWFAFTDDLCAALTRGTVSTDDMGVLVGATTYLAIVAKREHEKHVKRDDVYRERMRINLAKIEAQGRLDDPELAWIRDSAAAIGSRPSASKSSRAMTSDPTGRGATAAGGRALGRSAFVKATSNGAGVGGSRSATQGR